MNIEYMILAQGSSIDRDRNTVSLFDIIEELNVSGPPEPFTMQFQLISVLKRENEVGELSFDMQLDTKFSDNSPVHSSIIPIKMEATHTRFRIRWNLNLAIYPHDGIYSINIYSLGKIKLEKKIEVKVSRLFS